MKPYIEDDLNEWVNTIGEPLVLAAMKRALERVKESWEYIKGILQAWLEKGFATVREIEGEVLEFRRRRDRKESWAGR